MGGWSWFRKKRVEWGVTLATEVVLNVLKRDEPADVLFPLKSTIVKSLRKGFVGVHDRWIITVAETEPGIIQLSMNDTGDRRDQQLKLEARSEAALSTAVEGWRTQVEWWRGRLSAYRLQPGKTYRVLRTFTDYYGSVFEAGYELVFVSQSFLPYHGGHTLSFQPSPIYLQENIQIDILSNFDTYFEEVPVGS